MLTTHPSIMLGSYIWDQDWLPHDEFRIRMAGLQRAMDDNGWAGVLVYGDAREHAALAWFSNFIPRMRWAMALLPREGEPRLLSSMSSRDIPAMKTMTWIGDVYSGWEWQHFDNWIGSQASGGTLATIGFDIITPLLFASVESSIAGKFQLAEADHVVDALRTHHRPRELALIKRSGTILNAAAASLSHAFARGDDFEVAVLEAERTAREMAAQDVRTLISRDQGRTLTPYSGTFDHRGDSLLAYIAVKASGYWAEKFQTLSRSPRDVDEHARTALAAIVKSARAGTTAAELHDIARAKLGNFAPHPLLGGSIGHRIGLSLVEGPQLGAASDEQLAANTAYTLRVGALDENEGGAIASTMVLIGTDGAVDLLSE